MSCRPIRIHITSLQFAHMATLHTNSSSRLFAVYRIHKFKFTSILLCNKRFVCKILPARCKNVNRICLRVSPFKLLEKSLNVSTKVLFKCSAFFFASCFLNFTAIADSTRGQRIIKIKLKVFLCNKSLSSGKRKSIHAGFFPTTNKLHKNR